MADHEAVSSPIAKFDLGRITSGDIVFVYGQSIGAAVNIAGQRLLSAFRIHERIPLREQAGRYSHVMLGIGDGLVIHADGKKVAIDVISEALHYETEQAAAFKVFRRRNLSSEHGEQIAKSAIRYYNQKYRFSPYFTGSNNQDAPQVPEDEDTTQFCSRLVASAYRSCGAPISSLFDHKTLPIDLYQACQAGDWFDATAEFTREPLAPEAVQRLEEARIAGAEVPDFNDFFVRSDIALRELAETRKQSIEMHFRWIKRLMRTEVGLAQYVTVRFRLAQRVQTQPDLLDDDFALGVVRILNQIESLLALALVPTIDSLVGETLINKIDEHPEQGPYVGLPPPIAVREMQRAREIVTTSTYLLMAEVGLLAIVAYATSMDNVKAFKAVKRQYVEKFLENLKPAIDLAPYETGTDFYNWIDDEDERIDCCIRLHNIVVALTAINHLRKSGSSG